MPSEEKRIWGIHTKDDSLFLHQDVIAIGCSEVSGQHTYYTWNQWN